jgi:hypothetical protein
MAHVVDIFAVKLRAVSEQHLASPALGPLDKSPAEFWAVSKPLDAVKRGEGGAGGAGVLFRVVHAQGEEGGGRRRRKEEEGGRRSQVTDVSD